MQTQDGFDDGALTARRLASTQLLSGAAPAPASLADPAVFDWRYYLASNGDLGAAGINTEAGATQHWLQYGIDEGRTGCSGFDARTYLARYGDLSAAYGADTRAAITHYLTYGISEGRSGAPAGAVSAPPPPSPAPVGDSALSLRNPNLRLFDPNDQPIGTLGDASNPSDWMVKQWHTPDVLTPGSAGVRSDSALGSSRQALVSASSALAVYDDPAQPGNLVYELATAGGENSNYGGRNLFLQRELAAPVAVNAGARIELDYKVPYESIAKSADFDAQNVAQLHLGMVLHNDQTGETLFLQREMLESNNTGHDAHVDGNPNDPSDRGTHVGLHATSMRPGEDLRVAPSGWAHANLDVTQQLREALASDFAIQGGGSYRYRGQDLASWHLSTVYFGTETAGNAVLTVQVKNLSLATGT
jgi:hypothetical protein